MKVIKTAIEDVVIIEPDVFGDSRGYFFESYSQKKFDEQVREVIDAINRTVELRSFTEVIPSMNDIFIRAVNGKL